VSTNLSVKRAGLALAATIGPAAAAWRFARIYRDRAGFPTRFPPRVAPDALGLAYQATTIPSDGLALPAWWIPARDGAPGPGVLLVHGWESARDRTLPNAVFLHAAGFHVLTIDVRGHGANAAETLPVSAAEFGADAHAGFRALMARPEVTRGAILGHSMGAIGALIAGAREPSVGAIVATSTPAGPYRLTRQTFRLANLPIPDPIAWPLAWLTLRVFLEPRGHRPDGVSAAGAATRYRGPLLLVHGADDRIVPRGHLDHLHRAAANARRGLPSAMPVETLVIQGGAHSWLYESADYRARVAGFLADALGGPLSPEAAAEIAARTIVARLPEAERTFTALADLAPPEPRSAG
jgi:pimeloyl-ACP methyl ester carboxylesterase